MTRSASPPENDATLEKSTARRPYRAPKLRHLGSVRELTLGGTMGKAEGGGTFKAATMGM